MSCAVHIHKSLSLSLFKMPKKNTRRTQDPKPKPDNNVENQVKRQVTLQIEKLKDHASSQPAPNPNNQASSTTMASSYSPAATQQLGADDAPREGTFVPQAASVSFAPATASASASAPAMSAKARKLLQNQKEALQDATTVAEYRKIMRQGRAPNPEAVANLKAMANIRRQMAALAKNRRDDRGLTQGSQASLARYGATAGKATDQQLLNRIQDGLVGRGAYAYDADGGYNQIAGNGGFFDDLLGFGKGLGSALLAPAVAVGAQALDRAVPGMGLGTAVAPVAFGMGNKLLGNGAYGDEEGDDGSGKRPREDADDDYIAARGQPLNMRAPIPKYDRRIDLTSGVDATGRPLQMITRRIDTDKVQYNNVMNPNSFNSRTVANIRSVGDETGDLIFTHNEYLKDVTSLGPHFHTMDRIEINPGLAKSFPVLAAFASKFEEYDFIQCVFHFRSLVTDGNSTAAGSIMLCPSYNPANSDLTEKRQVENCVGSVSDKVTADLVCGMECANDKVAFAGLKYVRTVEVDPIGRRLYDLGFLQVAAQGVPAGLPVGELWCSYQVRLSKMRVDPSVPMNVGDGWTYVNSDCRAGSTGSGPGFSFFNNDGTGPAPYTNGGAGMVITNVGNGVTYGPVNGSGRSGGFTFQVPIIGGSQFTSTWTCPLTVHRATPFVDWADANLFVNTSLVIGSLVPMIRLQNAYSTVPLVVQDQKNAWAVNLDPANSNLAHVIWTGTVNIQLQSPGQQGLFKGTLYTEFPAGFYDMNAAGADCIGWIKAPAGLPNSEWVKKHACVVTSIIRTA